MEKVEHLAAGNTSQKTLQLLAAFSFNQPVIGQVGL